MGRFSVITAQVICFFLLLLLSACREQDQPLPPLLEVGQRTLTMQQFNREMALAYPDISGLPDNEQLQLKKQLIKQLIDRELILGEAARLNVQITPDELDAALLEVRGSYSAEEFDEILRQSGKTREGWLAALKLRLLTAKVSEAVLTSRIEVNDAELETYYREHKEDFRRPVEIRARQMLLKTRAEAVEIQKMVKAGEDFAELAREYSQSPDRESGGALGYFAKGQLPAEFDAVLFRLPVHQVSEPVESPYGYHLFFVERRRPAGVRPYAAVKEEIAEMLYQQKEEAAFQDWLETLQDSTQTTVRWNLLVPEPKP